MKTFLSKTAFIAIIVFFVVSSPAKAQVTMGIPYKITNLFSCPIDVIWQAYACPAGTSPCGGGGSATIPAGGSIFIPTGSLPGCGTSVCNMHVKLVTVNGNPTGLPILIIGNGTAGPITVPLNISTCGASPGQMLWTASETQITP
jgi:hypothetical protein